MQKMSKETKSFGDNDIEKRKFYYNETPIF